MDALRYPTPDLEGFQLPTFNATRQEWEETFAALRAVALTWPQILAGYGRSIENNRGFPTL